MSLAVRGLVKRFGGVVALDEATVDFVPGAINGLIGPNGSGKTTLFNIATGLIAADAGDVVFEGRRITGMAPYRIARSGIGRTFQVVRAFDRMTVLENVLVAERRTGLRELVRSALRGSEVDRAMGWLQRVGLDHLADADAADISYGQKKLLELAAILMTDPSLVMLDEPAGGVNPVMIERIGSLVRAEEQWPNRRDRRAQHGDGHVAVRPRRRVRSWPADRLRNTGRDPVRRARPPGVPRGVRRDG